MMRLLFLTFGLVSLMILACGSKSDGREALSIARQGGGSVTLRVEVADTPAELEQGLTGRTSLPANAGMLFVIEKLGPGFWMKDTPIALSVGFIGECGEIVALADMEPNTLDIHSTDRPYRFGLEVNQGWFQKNRLAVGDTVKIPARYKRPGCS